MHLHTGNEWPNMVTWTKYAGNPVISGNHGWDTPLAIDPEFRNFNGTYYLFYTGQGSNGFATSPNPEGPWSQNNNKWIRGLAVTGSIPKYPAELLRWTLLKVFKHN